MKDEQSYMEEKIDKPDTKKKTEDRVVTEFNLSQRRWLADRFKDCLVNLEAGGQQYFKRLGPTVQAVMREAIHFIVLYKELEGKVIEEKHTVDDVESLTEFVEISVDVFQPGTNDKITLTRKYTKSLLDTK